MHVDCMRLYSQCHAQDLDTVLQLCTSKLLGQGCEGEGGDRGLGGEGAQGGPWARLCTLVKTYTLMTHDRLCQNQRCQPVTFVVCLQRLKQLRKSVHSEEGNYQEQGNKQSPAVQGVTIRQSLSLPVHTTRCYLGIAWAARYNTWLLIALTLKVA